MQTQGVSGGGGADKGGQGHGRKEKTDTGEEKRELCNNVSDLPFKATPGLKTPESSERSSTCAALRVRKDAGSLIGLLKVSKPEATGYPEKSQFLECVRVLPRS